jgi:glucans biosynthesis protein C
MSVSNRRYDIDWLRVIAIGLLLLYHAAIGFQSWGTMIGFITTSKAWESLWIPMTMLNVWRIPLLFFVSGMGVYFTIQNRNWKQLLKERARRIFIPFVFGIFVIAPIQLYLFQHYYNRELNYHPDPAHLWFLGNIFAYVILLSPVFFYLKRNEGGRIVTWIKKCLSNPFGLLLVIAIFIVEVLLVHPNLYELYAMTWHGFFLGLPAFFFGFCFMLSGPSFWNMLLKWRWLFLAAAVLLYTWRLFQFQMRVPNVQLVIESNLWVFSVFAFGYRYLNSPGKTLRYLSQAAYPVYIIHMIFLFLASLLIFPLDIDLHLKFILVLVCTVTGCFIFYEFIIRRVNIIRPLFGLRYISSKNKFSVRKYSILFGIIISILLLAVATLYYPGGSQHDINSIGYDWKNNHISNLFGAKAVNGSDNASRFWAVCGMFFLCISFALFFIEFSKRIPSKGAASIIKYFGSAAMICVFLTVTPYHDIMITISSTLTLISIFYITVFVLKSKLYFFKILCIVCLLVFYCCLYIYYARNYLEILPAMQKIVLVITITWILSLQYFTTIIDFQPGKNIARKTDDMSTNH